MWPPLTLLRRSCRIFLLSSLLPAAAGAQIVREDFDATDGPVNKLVISGSTLYLAGDFHQVGPVSGPGAPLDVSTGLPETGFPRVTGSVRAVAADGVGGWYIGGVFTDVGGVARSNLAHVRADHSVASWNPNANGSVRALVVSGGLVFVAGGFTNVGGQQREGVAALGTVTGLAKASWSNPGADGTTRTLAISGSTLYVGGDFTVLGGQARNYIAALDTSTGLATSWNPNANNGVWALVKNGTTVYAGGYFTNIGGQPRNYLAALSTASNTATSWNPNANNSVLALALKGTTLYAGGLFTVMGGLTRNRIAEVSLTTTGATTAWDANADGLVYSLKLTGSALYAGGSFKNIGGAQRASLAALDPATGAATTFESNAWNTTAVVPAVYALQLSGTKLFAGSDAENLGGKRRNYLAAIDVTSGAVTGWNPNPNRRVYALAASTTTMFVGGAFDTICSQRNFSLAEVGQEDGQLASDVSYGTDGPVYALALRGDAIYLGGDFNTVTVCVYTRPNDPTSRICTDYVGMNGVGAIDTTGSTNFNPCSDCVGTFLKSINNTVYASGNFDLIGGQPRTNAAALSAFNGNASAWAPDPDGRVEGLITSGSLIYLVGSFYTVGGQIRTGIGAVDALTGSATAWDALSNGLVHGLAMSGSTAFVGGDFSHIGGQPRNRLAALDVGTASATPWNPNANGSIYQLVLNGGSLYAGGAFTTIGGKARPYLAAVGTATVDVPDPTPNADIALLQQNAPNPFNARTLIRFSLVTPQPVTLKVYDLAGRQVASLIENERRPAGLNQVEFRAAGLPSGVYLYRLTVGDRVLARKMLFLR